MNDNNNFDLLHIFKLIFRRKKFILTITLVATAIALLISILAPSKFTSSSIFIVKNPILMDRNYIFRNQMFENKEFFAVPEDVDQVELISKSEALIRYLIEEFDLANYYGIKNPYILRWKIKMNFAFDRQDTKNIEIFYTDKDPEMARKITKAIRDYLEVKFVKYFIESNKSIINALQAEMKIIDSSIAVYTDAIVEIKSNNGLNNYLIPVRGNQNVAVSATGLTAQQVKALEELHNYTALKDKLIESKTNYTSLIHEFDLVQNGEVGIFYLVQDAYTPTEASHPKTILITLGTLVGAAFISMLIVVFSAFYKEKIKE
jgi:uncharacterized protein involved in exopolysaccharide biosynthesis